MKAIDEYSVIVLFISLLHFLAFLPIWTEKHGSNRVTMVGVHYFGGDSPECATSIPSRDVQDYNTDRA